MPAVKRITKEMIIKAAMKVFRTEGLQSVTSRRVAQEIGCSTQPIYVEYKNMDELKADLIKMVVNKQNEIYNNMISDSDEFVYRSYGMSLLKFAQSEPYLFKQIYIIEGKIGRKIDRVRLPKIFDILENQYGYTKEQAAKIHEMASSFLMGFAVFMCSGYKKASEEEMNKNLDLLFVSICSVYGPPPKLMKTEEFKKHYNEIVKKTV